MLIRIKNFEYVGDYKLKLLFSNKKTKIIDFEPWINEGGTYLNPLKDIKYFKKVRMDKFNYSICWPNGADFCPDVLYDVGQEVKSPKPKQKSVHTHRKNKPSRELQN